MPSEVRYEIIETIAQGDFAVVYRARDSELQREVAIKQIHTQYLQDPNKLDQYWKEAQLLASLEHPYIMTIYDIDRSRGWLILELMRGSLRQQLDGNPIDLESLRLSLIYMLHALGFLERNGIVHGDVKPSNLLLDKNNRVKLGDFGIARRMTSDDGSVVKGTTKYMAPEVVSDQFGAVGPHSDLYSLGFSAFELMCGSHFDTLFPGLNMFGRDQQIAWMMWHSALDRRLPEISRVLEGVPDDLAYVIQKLTQKEPSKRYRSAEDVLDDLRASQKGEMPGAAEAAAAETAFAATAQRKKKKLLAYGAVALSLCLTIGMVFLPSGTSETPKQIVDKPTGGVVEGIDLTRNSFALRTPNAEAVNEIKISQQDRIELNGRRVTLAELRVDDEIEMEIVIRKVDGQEVDAQEIIATRPEGVQTESYLVDIDAGLSVITLADGDQRDASLKVYVPKTIPIWLNNSDTINGRTTSVADLAAGDHVRLTHVKGERERVATSLRAKRVDTFTGKIVEIDPGKKTLTARSQVDSSKTLSLPLSDQCTITLNGINAFPNGIVVSLNHLEKGYDVSIKHDTHILLVEATHLFTHSGVVQTVDAQAGTLTVKLDDPVSSVRFSVGPDAQLSVNSNEPVMLNYVRPNDRVAISHASADLLDPMAVSVSVDPISDPHRWSILIGRGRYERLPKTSAERDVQAVAAALQVQYRVPVSQNLTLLNNSIDEIRTQLTPWLADIPADSQLIIYCVGHAFEKDGLPFLAEERTNFYELEGGLSLQWLISELDACRAQEKLLLLDTCHQIGQNFEAQQPSTAELVSMLSDGPTDPVSATVTVIASCRAGERGRLLDDGQSGRFAAVVSRAFQGEADANSDHRVSADELFAYLESAMATYQSDGQQTPILFAANPHPPRLSAEKKQAVLSLLAYLQVAALPDDVDLKFAEARQVQPDQPDDLVAQGLLFLKHNRTRDSERIFAKLAAEYPDELIPHHALAWQYFMQRKYQAGISELQTLVAAMPAVAAGDDRSGYHRHALEFAGVLRTFAMTAPDQPLTVGQVGKLDDEVIRRGYQAKQDYAAGVKRVKTMAADVLSNISHENDQAERESLGRELRRLTRYHRIDFGVLADYVRANLED